MSSVLQSHQPAVYKRREPASTVLHKVIRENLMTFLEQTEDAGIHLPRTVAKEFSAYLRCGDLSAGFMRGECRECRRALLIAFSCKRRTACPSCGAKRMAALAAHLVDRVFPEVPIRHWVLSIPFDLRFLLATDRSLLSAVLRIFIDVVTKHRISRSKAGPTAQCGAVAFIHRADSALHLNPHYHVLFLDRVYTIGEHDEPRHHASAAPSETDLKAIAATVARRVRRLFLRRGLVDEAGVLADALESHLPIDPVQFGWLTPDGEPLISAPDRLGAAANSAEVAGFSVFAGAPVPEWDRDRLELLCRYGARPPLAAEQVSETNDGRIALHMRKPRRNGETHAFMTPLQFLRRLTSLIPPAGMNMLRYFGCLAPAAKLRSAIVPTPVIHLDHGPNLAKPGTARTRTEIDWASLLRRVYEIDALKCECGGRIRIISLIEDPKTIRRILDHLQLPTDSPPVASARAPPDLMRSSDNE